MGGVFNCLSENASVYTCGWNYSPPVKIGATPKKNITFKVSLNEDKLLRLKEIYNFIVENYFSI